MSKFNIYAFADEASPNIDEQIIAMKRNSLQGLEIRNVDGTNIGDITKEKAKEVRKKMDDAGLITWSIGSPMGKIDIKDDFSPHLEKFKNLLEITEILGAKNIRLFSFFMPENDDYDNYKNEVTDRLGKFIEAAKGTGINLCHENEKGIFGDNAKRCLELFKALPELKGIFDPANFVQCGQDTLDAWEMLKDYIHYMHIKDAFSGGAVVPAGKGDGNIPYIAKEYMKMGKSDFTMEPHLAVFSGLDGLEKDGNTSDIGTAEYVFKDNDEAFDTACTIFKQIIMKVS